MILVIDVGNTNITCGVYEGSELKATFRITTKSPRTSDEYGIVLAELLEIRGIKKEEIDMAIELLDVLLTRCE